MIGDSMEKQILFNYIELLNRYEEVSKQGNSLHPTQSDNELIKEVKSLYAKNEEYKDLIQKIHRLPPEERRDAVDKFFSRESNDEQDHTEEEVIAKTFGVDVSKIQHQYLENGKQIFSFYNPTLGKEIVLENDKKGKSLVERLKEIQMDNEKYQSNDEVLNANRILTDERNQKNLELDMLSKEEINEKYSSLIQMSPEDFQKLQYLMSHYESLHIKGINLENLVYLDEENKVHEVIIRENQQIAVSTPGEADYSNSSFEAETNSFEEQNKEEPSASDLVDEEENNVENNPEYVEGKIEENSEKPKVFTKNDKYGFIDNVLFVAIAVFVIMIIVIVVFLLNHYL